MGYCYQGRWLVCDKCGAAGPKVRKRACPAKVTYPDGHKLPMCPAPALCPGCIEGLRKSGAWKESHAECFPKAKERTAKLAAEAAARDNSNAEVA